MMSASLYIHTVGERLIEKMKKAISVTSELLEFGDQNHLEEDAIETDTHHHVTLKSSCPTRWNSSLAMVQSVLDMK